MFDIGWLELLLVGVVALIVIGPKDLPGMFRTLGRFTAKAKGMARDFQHAMNEAADEAGVKDVASDLKAATSKKSLGLDALDDVAKTFEDWDPMASDKDEKALEAKATKKAQKAKAAASKPKAKTAVKKPAAKPRPKVAAKPKAAAANKPKPKAKTAVKKPAAKPKPKTAAKPKVAAKPKAAAKPKTGEKS